MVDFRELAKNSNVNKIKVLMPPRRASEVIYSL